MTLCNIFLRNMLSQLEMKYTIYHFNLEGQWNDADFFPKMTIVCKLSKLPPLRKWLFVAPIVSKRHNLLHIYTMYVTQHINFTDTWLYSFFILIISYRNSFKIGFPLRLSLKWAPVYLQDQDKNAVQRLFCVKVYVTLYVSIILLPIYFLIDIIF